jgi:hypothetical protein
MALYVARVTGEGWWAAPVTSARRMDEGCLLPACPRDSSEHRQVDGRPLWAEHFVYGQLDMTEAPLNAETMREVSRETMQKSM